MRIVRVVERLFDGTAGNVFRGMATLAFGAILARMLGIISIPIITRIYSPEAVGVLSIFTATIMILVPFMTLRYVVAIPLPRNTVFAINLLALCVCIMLCMTILSGIVLFFYSDVIFLLLNMEELTRWWWLIMLGVMGAGCYELLTMWATRNQNYRIVARTQVSQSIAGEVCKIALGLLLTGPVGLLIGHVVGLVVGIGSLLTNLRIGFSRNTYKIQKKLIQKLAVRYKGYPLYRLPSQLFLIYAMQAPLFFTAMIYDANTTGQLGLAMLAIALPFNLVGQSMSRAYYAEIAMLGIGEVKRIRSITVSSVKRLFLLSLPLVIILSLGGEQLFAIAFGESWRMAGKAASIMSLYLTFQFVTSPLLEIFNLLGGQKLYLKIYFQRAVIVTLVFVIGLYFNASFYTTITFYTVAMMVNYTLVMYRIFILLNVKEG